MSRYAARFATLFISALAFIAGFVGPSDDADVQSVARYGLAPDNLPALPVADQFEPPPFVPSIGDEWRHTRPLDVALRNKDGRAVGTAEVRAIRTRAEIFIAIRYSDDTESVNRLWVFRNGIWQTGLLLNPRTGEWLGGSGSDDAAAVIIPDIDARPALAARGLDILSVEKPDSLRMDALGKADVWLWRAQQTTTARQAADMVLYPGTVGLLDDSGTGGPEPNGASAPL